ncbi:MAG TPA: YncE family protein [Geminicoccaceae bacterium]|nr:YncE family protein [Geminicoccus sp.]HMU49106.1 YncE family protein [Geminicoccaceae bacterium]
MRNLSLIAALLLAVLACPALALDLQALRSYAFVASRSAGEVTVLDMRDASVAGEVVLRRPAYQLAVREDRKELVVGSLEDSRVAVIDLATMHEARSVVLDHEPEHMQLSPNGEVLAVGNFYADALTLIDLDTMTTRRVGGLSQPHNTLFSPDGARLYVANLGSDRIGVVDVALGALLELLPVPREPDDTPGITSVMLSRDGRHIWAIPSAGSEVARLDVASAERPRRDRVGPQPWRVAFTSDERLMITANAGDQTLSLVDMAKGREVARLDGTDSMEAILPAWFDTTGFVTSRSTRSLLAIDLDKAAPLEPIALPGTPEGAVATPDRDAVVVALSEPAGVAFVDARERVVRKVVDDVVRDPFRIVTVGSRNICD